MESSAKINTLTPLQFGRIFRKHYGEAARLARDLDLSRTTLSRWFRGHVVSQRIHTAVEARAEELLKRR